MDSTRRAEPGSGAPPVGLPAGARACLAFYDLVWALGLTAASPYLAVRAARRREEMRERFGGWTVGALASPLWIHAAIGVDIPTRSSSSKSMSFVGCPGSGMF